MPPSPELSSLDYTPDNAAYIAHCMAQAAHWGRIRKALLAHGIKGRGLHLATLPYRRLDEQGGTAVSARRSDAPPWALSILAAGGFILESGEHGQWTVVYGDWYVTDADCGEGNLAVGAVSGTTDDPFYDDPDELPILDALAVALG